MTTASDPQFSIAPPTRYRPKQRTMVTLPLDEIQRLRDQIMRVRNGANAPFMRQLFGQVAGLYERLAKQAKDSQPPSSSPA